MILKSGLKVKELMKRCLVLAVRRVGEFLANLGPFLYIESHFSDGANATSIAP